MNALKIINIALLSLLIVLFINLFQPKQTTIPTNEISIAVTPNNVTIPSIPKVTVHNTTSDSLDTKFAACKIGNFFNRFLSRYRIWRELAYRIGSIFTS